MYSYLYDGGLKEDVILSVGDGWEIDVGLKSM